MLTNIYLVECSYRNTRTMKNSQQSKVIRQKAFENEIDAINYYFFIQDALLMDGCEFVNYNASITRQETLLICDFKRGYRYFNICVKLIPLM